MRTLLSQPARGEQTAIAMRTLYAEIVKARVDKQQLQPKRAFFNFTRLLLSRVKAHGAKWRRWYMGQKWRQKDKRKDFPANQHGENALIQIDHEANYTINPAMREYLLYAKTNQQAANTV